MEVNDRVMIKPKEGLKVRDPISMLFLPDAGKEVVWSSYWERRLIDGDVVLVEVQKSNEPAALDAKKKKGDN